MNYKKNSAVIKTVGLLLITIGVMAAEPEISSLVAPETPLNRNPKLILDTRALVTLRQRQKILQEKVKIANSLEQVTFGLKHDNKKHLVELIYRESQKQNLDPQLIVALIKIESEFKPEALSKAMARGLMQVRFATAQEVAREIGLKLKKSKHLYEPYINIKIGTHYLAKMLKRFDNLELALTAYNMGPTKLKRRMVSKRKFSKRYSRRVLKVYDRIKAQTL